MLLKHDGSITWHKSNMQPLSFCLPRHLCRQLRAWSQSWVQFWVIAVPCTCTCKCTCTLACTCWQQKSWTTCERVTLGNNRAKHVCSPCARPSCRSRRPGSCRAYVVASRAYCDMTDLIPRLQPLSSQVHHGPLSISQAAEQPPERSDDSHALQDRLTPGCCSCNSTVPADIHKLTLSCSRQEARTFSHQHGSSIAHRSFGDYTAQLLHFARQI